MIVEQGLWMKKRIWAIAAAAAVACGAIPPMQVQAAGESGLGREDRAIYEQLRAGQRVEVEKETAAFGHKTVYLTFDDGPSKLTPDVLDILKEEEVPATFFVLGELAKQQPKLIRRILDEGHALGNHSYNHVYGELYQSFDGMWNQFQKTDDILKDITGKETTLLRAPGGTYTNFDAFSFYYLDQAGYRIADWNVESGDAARKGVPAAEIIRNVKASSLQQEVTVLMHDGAGHGETVKALPTIIAYYKERGYTFATLENVQSPVRFRLGKSKWDRPADSAAAFASRITDMRAYRERKLGEGTAGKTPSAPEQAPTGDGYLPPSGGRPGGLTPKPEQKTERKESNGLTAALGAGATAPVSAVPLVITFDGAAWTLPADMYEFEGGRFAVSLPELCERMGGTYELAPDGRRAIVQTGLRRAVVDFDAHTVILQTAGKQAKVFRMADVYKKDGECYAGLRMTADWFGWQVAGYSLGETRLVELQSGTGGWPAALPIWSASKLILGQTPAEAV